MNGTSERSPQTMGQFFKSRTRELGWNQNQLARETNLSPTDISRVFTGRTKKPSAETVIRIARVLGLGIDDLYPYAFSLEEHEFLELADTLPDFPPELRDSLLRYKIPFNDKLGLLKAVIEAVTD